MSRSITKEFHDSSHHCLGDFWQQFSACFSPFLFFFFQLPFLSYPADHITGSHDDSEQCSSPSRDCWTETQEHSVLCSEAFPLPAPPEDRCQDLCWNSGFIFKQLWSCKDWCCGFINHRKEQKNIQQVTWSNHHQLHSLFLAVVISFLEEAEI